MTRTAMKLKTAAAAVAATVALAGGGAIVALEAAQQKVAEQPAAVPPPADAVKMALMSRVTVTKTRMPLNDVCEILNRKAGLCASVPPGNFVTPVRLKAGEQTAGEVLNAAAKSLGLDLEVVEHKGKLLALFWERPDPEFAARLRKLAESADEGERCTAARWLPRAGDKASLRQALTLLDDKSRRVRMYAGHGLRKYWTTGFYAWRTGPLPILVTPENRKAVAEELGRLADEQMTDAAGRSLFVFMQLASAFGDSTALPALEKIARRETIDRPEIWEGSTILHSLRAIALIGGPDAEKILLDLLATADGKRKGYVAEAVMTLDTPKGHEAAASLLLGEIKDVPKAGLPNMVGIPGNQWAVKPLIACLEKEPDYLEATVFRTPEEFAKHKEMALKSYRYGVAHALCRLGTPEGTAALKKQVDEETNPDRAADICFQLAWMGVVDGEWLLQHAEKYVASGSDRALQTGIMLIGMSGQARALPILERLLKPEQKHYIRSRAVYAMAQIGAAQALAKVMECFKSEDVELRAAAAQAAGDYALERAREAVLAALKDQESRVRMTAARALGKIGGPEDIDALLEASKVPGETTDPKTGAKRPDPYNAAWVAVEQIGVIGGERAARELAALAAGGNPKAVRSLLTSRDPHCRKAAVNLLGKDGPVAVRRMQETSSRDGDLFPNLIPEAVPVLIGLLSDSDIETQKFAAGRLSGMPMDPRAVAPLCGLLRASTNEWLRLTAVNALRGDWDGLVDPAAANALVEVCKKDSSKAIRDAACFALTEMGACGGPEAAAIIGERVKEAEQQIDRERERKERAIHERGQ